MWRSVIRAIYYVPNDPACSPSCVILPTSPKGAERREIDTSESLFAAHHLSPALIMSTPEHDRLHQIRDDIFGWRRWGPYVSERSWATVREDYSADGDAWNYLPHDLARSKAYRWGEDAIA